MNLSAKIAYNTIIQIISKLASTGLALGAVAIMTRYLGQTGFGEYTTIITWLSFFAIFADLGLTLITAQSISKPNVNEEKILGNLFALRLVTAFFFLSLAPLFVLLMPYNTTVKQGVLITSLAFFFTALNQIMVGLFQKNLRMDKVSIAEIISRLVLIVLVVLSVKQNLGLNGLLWATVIAAGVNFIFHFSFARQFCKIKPYFDLKYWIIIIKKSWPLALTIIFNLIYLKADMLLLSLIKRPTKIGIIAEVGIYGAAYKVIDVLITLPFIFSGIMLPLLTSYWTNNNKESFNKTLQKAFNILVIFAIPLIIGTQFVSQDIMALVAGKKFIDAGNILKILILAAGSIFFGNIFAHAIIAIDKQKKIISAYVFTAFSAVVGYYLFIPRYGYFGAAWVTVYSETFIALSSIYLIWKYTKFFPNLLTMTKSLFASLTMIVVIYVLKYLEINNLLIIILAAITTYGVAIVLFRGLTKKDLQNLINFH